MRPGRLDFLCGITRVLRVRHEQSSAPDAQFSAEDHVDGDRGYTLLGVVENRYSEAVDRWVLLLASHSGNIREKPISVSGIGRERYRVLTVTF